MCQTFEVSHSKLNILILFLCTLYRLTYHCGALTFIGAENLPLKAPVQVKGLEISETELLVFCLFFFLKDLVIPIKLQSISLIYTISSIVQDNYSFSRWVYLWLQKDITKFKITS